MAGGIIPLDPSRGNGYGYLYHSNYSMFGVNMAILMWGMEGATSEGGTGDPFLCGRGEWFDDYYYMCALRLGPPTP